jgi:S-formylglutathione hydrolase FrmB
LGVFGPTSWIFLGVLAGGFGCLLWWLACAGHLALKVVAGVLAFAVSAVFGAALVNQHYAYYTTWGSMLAAATGGRVVSYDDALGLGGTSAGSAAADLLARRGAKDAKDAARAAGRGAGRKPLTAPPTPILFPPPIVGLPGSVTIPRLALSPTRETGTGRVVELELPGAQSGISRKGFVYLPPQYFDSAYAHTSFPVVELLHGDPGDPTGWVYALQLPEVMDQEINSGAVGPMIVVMPATFSGKHGQDCVNAPKGLQDDTYLSVDVPADVTHDFRALPQGLNWAIGGLSDGGFCAANLALRHPGTFGAVAALDGFYSAYSDLAVMDKVFGAGSVAIAENDPSTLAREVPSRLPRFWIMSGSGDAADTVAAQYFRQIVTAREPIEWVILRNGQHTPPAWRAALPSMLVWTWLAISGGPVATGTVQLGPPTKGPLFGSPASVSSGPTREAPVV